MSIILLTKLECLTFIFNFFYLQTNSARKVISSDDRHSVTILKENNENSTDYDCR